MVPRKHDRFSTYFDPVSVSFSGEARGVGKLYDISYGGCKVESTANPSLGTPVTLQFRTMKARKPLRISAGIVSWTVPHKYFGVKFLKLEQHKERALDQYLTVLNNSFRAAPERHRGNR